MKLYHIFVFNVVLIILSFFRSSQGNNDFAELIPNFDNPVNACAVVNCGQGTCHTDNSLLGFDCECYSDWKKFQIYHITFPPCIIPNCTLNLDCGAGSSPPPAPPPPSFNFSDPCTFTWCNDGMCKSNGSDFECDCNPGSDNLLNKTNLPCIKQCSLGSDCQRLGLGGGGGPAAPTPGSNSFPSAAPPLADSNSSFPPGRQQSSHGSRELQVALMIKDCWIFLLLLALFLPWL